MNKQLRVKDLLFTRDVNRTIWFYNVTGSQEMYHIDPGEEGYAELDRIFREKPSLPDKEVEEQDFEMGTKIYEEIGHKLTAHTFVRAVEQRIDYNRFDYEDGETDLYKAWLRIHHGFTQAGGLIDFQRRRNLHRLEP